MGNQSAFSPLAPGRQFGTAGVALVRPGDEHPGTRLVVARRPRLRQAVVGGPVVLVFLYECSRHSEYAPSTVEASP